MSTQSHNIKQKMPEQIDQVASKQSKQVAIGASKQVGSGQQNVKSHSPLLILEKHNLDQIASTQKNIESMRELLKELSNSASKIIEAKLKNVNKVQKTRQAFNPTYESKKLQQFKDQQEKIFREIDQTKALIQNLKLQQEPEIKSEILKRQIKIKQVSHALQKSNEEKKYVIEQLQTNKGKINSLKESTCNKEMIENEKQLQECKREKTTLEKKLNHITNQQILASLYLFEINSRMENLDQPRDQQQDSEDLQKEINALLNEINTIIGNRNQVEKGKNKEISQLKSQINQLEQEKNNLTNDFRKLEGEIMKRGLEERFYRSKMERVSKSTDFLNPNRDYSVQNRKRIEKSEIQTKYSTQALDKITNSQPKSLKLPRYKDNLIEIGITEMSTDLKILKDQKAQNEYVDRIHSITFVLSDSKVVGVKSTYLGKQGKKIVGDMLSVDSLQKPTEKEILVKEIKEIQYPMNSKNICLKIHKFNQSVQTIGTEYYGATHKINISLKNIKNIQFIVQKNKQGLFAKGKGILINLQSKVQVERFSKTEDVLNQTNLEESRDKVFLTSPLNIKKRAQSIDSVSTTSKKTVLKLSKKEPETNLDHRLLTRKKLV